MSQFDPKKAGEEADAMITELNQSTTEDQPEVIEPAIADETTPPVAETETAPEATITDQGVAAEEVTTPEPDNVTAQLASMQEMLQSSESRWKVAQGMIEKKDGELDEMRNLFAQLASQKSEASEPAQSAPADTVTTADIEEFSPELHKFIGKVAHDVASRMFSEFKQNVDTSIEGIQDGVNTVQQNTVATAQDVFEQRLAAEVPTWESINVEPGFLQWLNVVDPLSGQMRLEMLKAAYGSMNLNTTAAFFRAYLAETTPAHAPAEDTVAPPNVHDFVSPGKSKVSAAKNVAAPEGRLWSSADISKLYDDKMRKRISQKRFDELEADLFSAQHENRVVA